MQRSRGVLLDDEDGLTALSSSSPKETNPVEPEHKVAELVREGSQETRQASH